MCWAGTTSAVPKNAGSFSELLLRDDPAKPGHVIEDQLKAVAVRVAGGVRDAARLRAASRGPAVAGSFPLAGASYGAGSQTCSSCPALAGGQDAAGLAGIRSPGTVSMARSAASSIRSRRSISSPRYRTSDASSAVLRGWIRAQNAARPRISVPRLLIAARVATWGIPRHLSASTRPSGQPGPAGSPASFTGSRSIVIIFIGSSFAVCGCCGHCVRDRTRRAGGRLTADGTVSDQAVT